jgi:hypothetical protein
MLSSILVLGSRMKSNAWTTRNRVFHLPTSYPACCYSKKETLKVFLTQCLKLSVTGFGHMKAATITRMTTTTVSLKSRTLRARLAAFSSFFSSFILFLVFFLFMLHHYVFISGPTVATMSVPSGRKISAQTSQRRYSGSSQALEGLIPLGYDTVKN